MPIAVARSLCQSLRLGPAAGSSRHRPLFAAADATPPDCRLLTPALAPSELRGVSLLAVAGRRPASDPVYCLCNDQPQAILLLEGQLVAAGGVHLRIATDQVVPAGRTLVIESTIADPPASPALEITLRGVPASASEIVTGIGAPPGAPRRGRPPRAAHPARADGPEPVGTLEPLAEGGVRINAAGHRTLAELAELPTAKDYEPLRWPAPLLAPAAWTSQPLPSGAARCVLDADGTRIAVLVWQRRALMLRGVIAADAARSMGLA